MMEELTDELGEKLVGVGGLNEIVSEEAKVSKERVVPLPPESE